MMMYKPLKQLVLATLVCLVFLVPLQSARAQSVAESQYRALLVQQIETLLAEVERLQSLINQRTGTVSVETPYFLPESAVITDAYTIQNIRSVNQVLNQEHRRYIERFYKLVPDEFDAKITEVVFFSDQNPQFDAFIEIIKPYRLQQWRVGFHNDLLRFSPSSKSITELMIHEFGHIVALESLSKNDTYLEAFTREFWSGNEVNGEFVSAYAETSETEDFSETFATFVTNGIHYDGAAVQKVDWFYEQSELVSLRQTIRRNI